jgi:hypothetical protein
MDCQGGTLGYSDVWHLQRGRSLAGPAGETVTPEVLTEPAPAAGQAPVTDQTALRDRIEVWPLTRVLTEVRCGSQDWSWEEEWADLDRRHAETGYLDTLEQQIREHGITMPVLIGSDGRLWDGHHRLRLAVRLGIPYVPVEITPPAAVLPAPVDQAAVMPPPALTEVGRLRSRVQVLEEEAERNEGLAKVGARCMREGHQGLVESGRVIIEGHRFALSVKLGLGTGAPWDAIHERVASLRRMADEAQPAETEATVPVCICGHPEARHFEDVCQTCGCGDYLEPRDAAEVIARWRQAALKVRDGERAAVLREAADWYTQQGKVVLAASQVAADLRRRADAELRRMGDETQPDEAQPCRGDAFERWLKRQRDQYDRHGESSEFWHEFDRALDLYRLHADMGTPLDGHVCEAKAVGDCECLEQPAVEACQDGTRPSSPSA